MTNKKENINKTNSKVTQGGTNGRRKPIGRLPFFDLDWWQEIWNTITYNKMRSFLTAFGVFWGMFMFVVMVGLGNALESGIMSQVQGFASNSCFVSANLTSEAYKGFRKNRSWNIMNEDIPILLNKVPEIQYIAPVLFGNQSAKNVAHGNKAGSFGVKGNYPIYNEIDKSNMLEGRYINDIDMLEKRKVCVIGKRIAEQLFDKGESPLGKNVRVNGIYFQVVGVAESTSVISIGSSNDESVILPFSTFQQAYSQGNIVHFIAITADKGVKVKVVEDKVKAELKQIHNISPTDEKAVWTMNVEEQFTMFSYLGLGITILIWIVGMGTLVAGGVGISNIMLVTVRERTKEIGIRRALGATPRNIITQIMSESILLTIIAGIGAIVIGVGILSGVGIALEQADQFIKNPQISFGIAMIAFVILVVIGILAGYMPAKRAMNIKPIEAIREE